MCCSPFITLHILYLIYSPSCVRNGIMQCQYFRRMHLSVLKFIRQAHIHNYKPMVLTWVYSRFLFGHMHNRNWMHITCTGYNSVIGVHTHGALMSLKLYLFGLSKTGPESLMLVHTINVILIITDPLFIITSPWFSSGFTAIQVQSDPPGEIITSL